MSYTIDISDCPKGTYAKVRSVLSDKSEDYSYSKPVFFFLADDEQLKEVQAALFDLEGVEITGLAPEPAPEPEPEPEPEPKPEPEPVFAPLVLQPGDRFEILRSDGKKVSGDLHPSADVNVVLAAHAPQGGTLSVLRKGKVVGRVTR